jgi:BMFP domain-containing protein YqiC
MQTQSTLFDDLARLMTGAMGVAQGVGDEAKTFVRTQADRFVADMDLVSRDEFEAMRETVRELREKVAELEAKLTARE